MDCLPDMAFTDGLVAERALAVPPDAHGRQPGPARQLLDASAILGEDGDATVDTVHPNDVGFLRMAEALEAVLRDALVPPQIP